MNALDLAVLLILAASVLIGYKRGFIRTAFGMASFFVSLLLANRLYPYVSRMLRATPLYDRLKDSVIQSMGLKPFFEDHTAQTQTELIAGLPLPDALRDSLSHFNTPDMYELLNVRTIEDYIAGYFANIAINALSMILVFALVFVLMRLIGSALDLIGKLPVIGTFNRAGGLAAGLVTGLLVVWLGFALIHFLFASPSHPEVTALINGSFAARWLYANNWFFNMLTMV